MRSTRWMAHRAMVRTVLGALLALALLPVAAPAAHATPHYGGRCANRLCTRYVPHTPSCWRQHGHARVARCFIARAAARFGQSRREADYVAWRESRYHWGVTNSSSGAAGLFQFMPRTWRFTPYRHRSPYQPRWAALAAMWMWHHGYKSHWGM